MSESERRHVNATVWMVLKILLTSQTLNLRAFDKLSSVTYLVPVDPLLCYSVCLCLKKLNMSGKEKEKRYL